jgi:hypothetical protein
MRPRRRSQKAIAAGLPPGEAAALVETLTSGYQQGREASRRAYSPDERRARQELARDLRRLTLRERAAARQVVSRSAGKAHRAAPGGRRPLSKAAAEMRDLEAGA